MIQYRDQESALNLNMQLGISNSVMSFTNHFKTQEQDNAKQEGENNLFNYKNNKENYDYQQQSGEIKQKEQQQPNQLVFDIIHSFAQESLSNPVLLQNINSDQKQAVTGSSCSSFSQLSQRAQNPNNQMIQLKNNINIPNLNLQQNLYHYNTEQSISQLPPQPKFGKDDFIKSPNKSNFDELSGQKQTIQDSINSKSGNQNINLSSPAPPTPLKNHQKVPSIIINPISQQQQENKSSLYIPINQMFSQEQSISQNNSSVLCNTNAKSSYRSNSTGMNNNSQVNLNVKNLLNNNSNSSNTFDLNFVNNTNSSSVLANNNFQIINSNYQNINNSNNTNGILSVNSQKNNSAILNNQLNKSNLEENKMNLTGIDLTNRSFLGELHQQNISNTNNKSTINGNSSFSNSNNNISFVANCNNTTIMKTLEKNMGVSYQQMQHLINSSQQLQNNYSLEIEKYLDQLNSLKEKQEKCENKQKKKKKELEEIEDQINQVENKQKYHRTMILSDDQSRKQKIEITFNSHSQLDTVLQKMKNLISIIPDPKMHEKFQASTQPLESVLKQLSENKKEIIMLLLQERDEQMRISEYLSALREDFNSYIMKNTEHTLIYEENNEVLDSLKAQYPAESTYITQNLEYQNQKQLILTKLQQVKQDHENTQKEIHFKEQMISKFNENSSILQQRLEQARRNKSSGPDYQTYENQFQLFLIDSFDENASQFYKDFIKIFDAEFLQKAVSHCKANSNILLTKIISFQSLLLQETHIILSNQLNLNCEDLRRIQEQKRELMVDLNQVEMLREIILSILSYDQLLLNVSMCVRNMKRKDIIMQTFYQYLMSKKTQFSFKFQAQNDIISITDDYMRANKDLLNLEGEKKQLQQQISEQLREINILKSQLQQINQNLDNNENTFKIHYAKECSSYYEQYLKEKNIQLKDIMFAYGKAYVEKLEQDIKEEFDKANKMNIDRIKEQLTTLNQNMQTITDKRTKNFMILQEEIKPQYEEYQMKLKQSESKQISLNDELADIINKERVYIQQLNCILSDQFDLRNKKFNKGSALCNLQELMQASEEEAQFNYNQIVQLVLNQNTLKQDEKEISTYNHLQLLKEKMSILQEELVNMTRADVGNIAQIEAQLTKSESIMKDYHSKIEQIHSVLKDQLSKMNLDSDTIFNTFNLNFSAQVLNVKDLINKNQDRMKAIQDLANNGKFESKSNNTDQVKRSRCSKSMYIDISKSSSKQQSNHNQSLIQQSRNNMTNSQVQPKYGKITIDMNFLASMPDVKTVNTQQLQTSIMNSNSSFNQNKENLQPMNSSIRGTSPLLPNQKLNQSQKDDMMSSNYSEAFFNSNNSKSNNRLNNSGRTQSQTFQNKRQNSIGNVTLTSGRIPSSILLDPLYNELTSTNSIQSYTLQSSGFQQQQYQQPQRNGESQKSIQQITSSSNLTNLSSFNSPPSLSAQKNKSLFKRANSFNNTSSQQLNNNSSGNIAQQIHKITNSNNFNQQPNKNSNTNLHFTAWKNQSSSRSNLNCSNINNVSGTNLNNNSGSNITCNNFNNTFRDFSPNNKSMLQNYNFQPAYNNQHKNFQKQDQDRSEQNITLNLSTINHVHNGNSNFNHNNNNNNNNNNSNFNNLIHNNSLFHNISMNNNNNTKNQEQASAFLDISAINMISATNRNDLSGVFTQTLINNGNSSNNFNNSRVQSKNSNFLNENKYSIYDDNNISLNTNNDKSVIMTENNNQRALNTSQNRRLNSYSTHQAYCNNLNSKQSISSINSQSNSRYIEIYKMYGVSKENFVKKQVYDPINNNSKPTSFGYAKRFLRFNEKNQNLEILKEEIINQQSRKTIEQAYSKLLIKKINIPAITSSILEYKNEYRFKEPEDELISKFVNCSNLPFSIEVEKMGKIECIALNEEDLIYLAKIFAQ
ncbi:hypothetical protein TTHERM_00777290 (macronuclear) [Tetrahymena thermophila SB210]|uniref:Uncharacterized protein n=1 Tax=Tetrahymena thermophila (strain SB210) TaxID=312017 RepID=Q23WS6_TETTS|nr:hypothetical protein TTHERM_00777290 [Tetrahymena thermophila SB210]EAS01019.2 hypothetical protein TTHERM_00777290 [Tetrahymena thermophila SB210]|eukprot:XP_001021264.2 hypothetical protein TTHERM_00777290 [Tetrahymena thermophila SB210]